MCRNASVSKLVIHKPEGKHKVVSNSSTPLCSPQDFRITGSHCSGVATASFSTVVAFCRMALLQLGEFLASSFTFDSCGT